MAAILYFLFFLACGVAMSQWLLPRLRPLVRWYIGASLGVLLLMWLPALYAYLMAFTLAAHAAAAATMAALAALCFALRDRRPPLPFDEDSKRTLHTLLWLVVPLTLLSSYLQYTHSLRPAADGSLRVGQSTYGDLSLHLAVATSIENASFPLHNSLMRGATMAYPYLSDSIATSAYMLGLSLPAAMAFTGSLMMCLVYTGYTLLCTQLCRRRGAAFLAVCLLFLNGGLGFFYTLSGTVEDGVTTTAWDNLRTVITGYYQTPTNQPDPNNLRWSNIICDMLVPQRGILGGWTMLLPCLLLLLPPLMRREKHGVRALALTGLFAGGMPLVHTHSFLALGLASVGFCGYEVLSARRGERFAAFRPFLLYGSIAVLLALPQLLCFTFVQAAGSDHFLRFQFNWCNNRGGNGLVDPYFWFYLKNIGLPYLLIALALLRCTKRGRLSEDDGAARQHRRMFAGAFLIYIVAESILFQPNEYDNNKLFYVWFMLCLPAAAEYAMALYERLQGLAGRRVIAGLFLATCFLSAGLTVARECVSDYQAYSRRDVELADFVRENTPEHAVVLTGTQHLNPVASLAGRTLVCGSDLYLYFHGFSTSERKAEIAAFYESPRETLAFLKRYQVQYVYVSSYERAAYDVDEAALDALLPCLYRDETGERALYAVPDDVLTGVTDDPAEDVNAIGTVPTLLAGARAEDTRRALP